VVEEIVHRAPQRLHWAPHNLVGAWLHHFPMLALVADRSNLAASEFSSRISRQSIHLDCLSFPCSIGLDFSSVCKESDVRVNGSFHGCVDSPLVPRWIFVSFSSNFHRFFVCGLFLWFGGVWIRICWWESWIVASCIFVLDLDPQTPNSASD
jgi:hypothetical protein